MGGSVQLPCTGNNRKTCDFHLWKTGSGDHPIRRTVRTSEDTPIVRNVKVAIRVTGDSRCREVGEHLRSRSIQIRPCCGARTLIIRHGEDMPWRRRRQRAVTRVRDPSVVRIRRIDKDAAGKPAWTVRIERIEPRVRHAGIRCVGVLRDEDAASGRRGPQRTGIGSCPCNRCDGAAGPRRSTVIASGRSQIGCAAGPDANEVTTSRIGKRGRKFRTVCFEERLIAGPILSSPDAQRALENRPCSSRIRIGNDWRVKLRRGRKAFPAGYDRTTRDDPLRRIAVLEVHIVGTTRERVEPERRVGQVKARLPAIAVHDLGPGHSRAVGFKRAVVLVPTLQVLRIVGSD